MNDQGGPWDHPASGTVGRRHLAAAVRERGYTHRHSAALVDTVIDAMREALGRGEDVKLNRFGRFVVRTRPARVARNPRTGERVELPPGNTVVFQPSVGLRRLITDALGGEPSRDDRGTP